MPEQASGIDLRKVAETAQPVATSPAGIAVQYVCLAADKARQEVASLKADHEKIISEARREKDLILKEAKEIREKIVAEAKEKAMLEAQKSIELARQQIESEKVAAIGEIKKQVAELSVLVAEKILRKELLATDDQEKFVNDSLNDLNLN